MSRKRGAEFRAAARKEAQKAHYLLKIWESWLLPVQYHSCLDFCNTDKRHSHNMLFLMLFKLVLGRACVNDMFNLFKGTEMRLAAQLRWDSLDECIHPGPSICTGNKE